MFTRLPQCVSFLQIKCVYEIAYNSFCTGNAIIKMVHKFKVQIPWVNS